MAQIFQELPELYNNLRPQNRSHTHILNHQYLYTLFNTEQMTARSSQLSVIKVRFINLKFPYTLTMFKESLLTSA